MIPEAARDGSDMSPSHWDVVVVGAGMAGLSQAIALAGVGLKVAVLDRADPQKLAVQSFDGRTSAIARGSQDILRSIGLWPSVEKQAQAITEIRVSDGEPGPLGGVPRTSPRYLHYDCEEVDGEPMGAIVENAVLRAALFQRASELPSLSLFAPTAWQEVTFGPGLAKVLLADGRLLHSSLIVAADGKFSALRKLAGIAVNQWDYPQVGIVATVGHSLSHDAVAHEHFLPSGPFALLPMVDGPLRDGGDQVHRSSLVWTEDRAVEKSIMALSDAEFSGELQRRFGLSLGRLWVEGKRWSYPLSLVHAQRYHAKRMALIGDAAHAIHPIAGQGLNLGIRDVAALSEAIIDARRLGLDIGAEDVLARYEQWRRFDNTALVAATDGLNRLFSNNVAPLRLARDTGLAAVNKLPPLKRLFMHHAMGTWGDLPRLARGEPL